MSRSGCRIGCFEVSMGCKMSVTLVRSTEDRIGQVKVHRVCRVSRARRLSRGAQSSTNVFRENTYTTPFLSTPWMPPVTSHSPLVRNRGLEEFAGLNNAMWLYPSGVGTMSRYADEENEPARPAVWSRDDGRGYTSCVY